jgi:hypothetical protein
MEFNEPLTIFTFMKQKRIRITDLQKVPQPVVREPINITERNRERASCHCPATALSIILVSL